MQFIGGNAVCLLSSFDCIEASNLSANASAFDFSFPFAPSRVPMDALNTALTIALYWLVSVVFGTCALAKVIKPVVDWVSVDVVNVTRWPTPVNHQPNQTVHLPSPAAFQLDCPVPAAVDRPGNRTGANWTGARAGLNFPSESACDGVVTKQTVRLVKRHFSASLIGMWVGYHG